MHDDATLEQIRAEIDTLIAIDEAIDDFRHGRVHSFEEVIEMSESWVE
jgi:hypothetical protein